MSWRVPAKPRYSPSGMQHDDRAPAGSSYSELPDRPGLVPGDAGDRQQARIVIHRSESTPRCCRSWSNLTTWPVTETMAAAPPRVTGQARRCTHPKQDGLKPAARFPLSQSRGVSQRSVARAIRGQRQTVPQAIITSARSAGSRRRMTVNASPHSISHRRWAAAGPPQAEGREHPWAARLAENRATKCTICTGRAPSTGRRSRPACGWRPGRCRGVPVVGADASRQCRADIAKSGPGVEW